MAIFKVAMFTKHCEGLKNPLHAAAKNLDFVRGLEPPHYLVLGFQGFRVSSGWFRVGLGFV